MRTKNTRKKLNIHLQEESPLIAIQKVHLFQKQKAFLAKQAAVFEKKSQTLKEQVRDLENKIRNQKDLAVSMVKNLEVDKTDEVETIARKKHKAKNFFKLDY